MNLDLVSEKISPNGGVIADVMSNSISSTSYSQPETFLRETLQNACDQRRDVNGIVNFHIDVTCLGRNQKKFLDQLLQESISDFDPLNYRHLINQDNLEVVYVSDSGTNGLVGPLDASIDADPSNFASFFFTVGRPTSESSSGGSFGIGRTVLTAASDYSTVLIYSQFIENGRTASRFMGMAISESFSRNGTRMSGRHWLGTSKPSDNNAVSPIEGERAEIIAEALGLKAILGSSTGFAALVLGNKMLIAQEPGTSLNVLREALANEFRKSAYLYGWPHMLVNSGIESVKFSIRFDGNEIPMYDPESIPILRDYVSCYREQFEKSKVMESKDIYFNDIAKKIQTGILTWFSPPISTSDSESEFQDIIPTSSVALMRKAGFVVKYLEVAAVSDGVATRGVFRAADSFDSIFRKAEPVAHDDWIPARLMLKPGSRNPVKHTLDAIKANFREKQINGSSSTTGNASVLLGNLVGRFLDGLTLTGESPGKLNPSPPRKGGKKTKHIQIVTFGKPKVTLSNSRSYVSEFNFEVKSIGSEPVKVQFLPSSVLDNGFPDLSPPKGENPPKILKIEVDGRNVDPASDLFVGNELFEKIIKVQVRNAQGLGTICRVKVDGNNE
jgi:hypothetical protein